MPDRPDIHVGLAPLKLRLRHTLLLRPIGSLYLLDLY
jgi:hypothetical protein